MPIVPSKLLPVPILLLVLLIFSCLSLLSAQDGEIRLPSEPKGEGDGGSCSRSTKQTSCPINCFRPDPVCGEDGVTYWCGCADAFCHGIRVMKVGGCDVGSGGSSSVPRQALLLVHILWLILLGFSVLLGLF